jgi:hypothetical protein
MEEVKALTPEEQEDVDFIEDVHDKYRSNLDHTKDWREETVQSYNFVSCDQWSDEERAIMEEQLRPVITFNRTEVFVQAVTGLEALNRNEVRYLARKAGKTGQGQADMWTDAAKYVNDDCDAEVHHSFAFRDLVICGMGWTETRMDYQMNTDGDIKIERRDPLRMYWDTRATQRNAQDKRWVISITDISKDEVLEQWPGADITYSSNFAIDQSETFSPHDANKAWKYEKDQSKNLPHDEDNLQLVQYQWYETQSFYKVRNPMDGSVKEFDAKTMKKYREAYPDVVSQMKVVGPFPKRQYKRAFIVGWTVLEIQDIECEDFTFQCMTGKHDRNNNVWYGLMRNLKDPQQWVNKLYSQILHIINSNAKGGLIAEKDAFDNVQQAEEDWADPTKIVWTNSGAVSKGKIMTKPDIPYPAGLDKLMQYAMSMFTEVVGINMELLGLAEKVQAGVLEAQRKQAGMTILAWCFDAMRAYRKTHGRVLASYIREYISDGRLIRIVGNKGEEYLPLMRDKLAAEYDIVVAESPHSTNERDRVFAILSQTMPMLIDMGIMPPVEALDYLPLPGDLIEAWKANLNNPQQQKMQQMMQQLEQGMKQAELKNEEADTKLKEAGAMLKQAQAQTEPMKAVK